MNRSWRTIALVGVIGVIGGALISTGGFLAGRASFLPEAYAQTGGVIGRTIVVMGEPQNRFAPIVLVDTMDQTVVVYEYNYQSRNIELESVRTFRYDKQLLQYQNNGIAVEQVKRAVEEGRLIWESGRGR